VSGQTFASASEVQTVPHCWARVIPVGIALLSAPWDARMRLGHSAEASQIAHSPRTLAASNAPEVGLTAPIPRAQTSGLLAPAILGGIEVSDGGAAPQV
jgi:hypothetical protein